MAFNLEFKSFSQSPKQCFLTAGQNNFINKIPLSNKMSHNKSVNLQHITLGCLDDGTNESSTKSVIFQVLFFYTFYRLRALKTVYFYFCNFIKKSKKINWKDFCKVFCKQSWKKIILGTSESWSTIHLSHRPSIFYCKLTD